MNQTTIPGYGYLRISLKSNEILENLNSIVDKNNNTTATTYEKEERIKISNQMLPLLHKYGIL